MVPRDHQDCKETLVLRDLLDCKELKAVQAHLDRLASLEVEVIGRIELCRIIADTCERHSAVLCGCSIKTCADYNTHTHTHTRLAALCPGLRGWAGTRKVKPIWILLKQETASGSGTSWAICKSALCSRQITTSAPYHSGFYRPDALPATQPTASKHSRQMC